VELAHPYSACPRSNGHGAASSCGSADSEHYEPTNQQMIVLAAQLLGGSSLSMELLLKSDFWWPFQHLSRIYGEVPLQQKAQSKSSRQPRAEVSGALVRSKAPWMSNNFLKWPTVRDELCLTIDCAKRETSIQDIVHVLCSGLWGVPMLAKEDCQH
jgi:hypothetical protein